jgi:hypothetical protein
MNERVRDQLLDAGLDHHEAERIAKGVPMVDFFVGTTFSVREIERAHKELGKHIRDLGDCHEGKRAVSMKCTADDVAKVAGQIKTLASHLSGVTETHVNRQAKVRA